MPTPTERLDQARRNETFAFVLLHRPQPNLDWGITVLFYAALQLTEAYLSLSVATTLISPRRQTHVTRRRRMRERPELTGIIDAYDVLQFDSESTRYDCATFSLADALSIERQYYVEIAGPIRALIASLPSQG